MVREVPLRRNGGIENPAAFLPAVRFASSSSSAGRRRLAPKIRNRYAYGFEIGKTAAAIGTAMKRGKSHV
jgi:hypothetical protein